MKKFVTLVLALLGVFVMNALGEGVWEYNSLTDKPIFQPKRGPSLASGSKVERLPLKLPIGSKRVIKDYIVASNNLAMNVIVGLAIYEPNTKELRNSRWSFGYGSYEDMLLDSRKIMEEAVVIFKTNNISPETMVYAILRVTYFNTYPFTDYDPIALNMINPASTFGTLTVDKAMDVLGIDDPVLKEQVVIPVPKLLRAEYVVDVSPTEQARMVWTEATGPQLANWQSAKEYTVQELVYLRSWATDGSVNARFTLDTQSGEKVTYTQYGVRMRPPEFSIRNGEVDVTVARGSNTEIATSQDMQNWKVIQSISSAQSSGPGDYQTFTFLVPMNQTHLIVSGGSH